MICRMTGIICPYANEYGYCDSTACHNMNIVGNIIPKERPENISNSSIWVKHQSNWQTGTPTEKGLYVVLTKVSTEGVSSSEGTYILDYWDGYSFQYLKRKAMTYALTEPDTYGWVAWQKIEPYKEKENGR